jgi:DNA-binding transcriptional MocR family regulator
MNPLYRQVAEEIAQGIAAGRYVPGERLPGVRSHAQNRKVSVATVVAAYQALADRGYIEARPRSGFYVRARPPIQVLEAEPAAKATPPRLVTGQSMAMALIKAANDSGIVQLGAAVPDSTFLPTQAISRALAQVVRTRRAETAGYMMPPGALELRRQIARRMSETGGAVSADDIVITTGCQEALSLALRAVTVPGDIVAVESPTFYGLLHVMESLGLEALEIPTHPRDGLALDALAFALERWKVAACVVSPNFSNPLGSCMPDEKKRALVRLLESTGFRSSKTMSMAIWDSPRNGRRPARDWRRMPTSCIAAHSPRRWRPDYASDGLLQPGSGGKASSTPRMGPASRAPPYRSSQWQICWERVVMNVTCAKRAGATPAPWRA